MLGLESQVLAESLYIAELRIRASILQNKAQQFWKETFGMTQSHFVTMMNAAIITKYEIYSCVLHYHY